MHALLRSPVSGLYEAYKDVRSLHFLAMKAMLLEVLGEAKPPRVPLRLVQHPEPTLAPEEVLLRVTRCGVCHTELDEIEGRPPPPHLPVILGHQVVGTIEGIQSLQTLEVQQKETLHSGDAVAVAWFASACGK